MAISYAWLESGVNGRLVPPTKCSAKVTAYQDDIDENGAARVKIETFALERWMARHELNVKYDIANGILPLKINICWPLNRKRSAPPRWSGCSICRWAGEAVGTHRLRSLIAATCTSVAPEQILVTTDAIEANFLLFNTLLEAGDHVVAVYPAYQQLYSVPRYWLRRVALESGCRQRLPL
ncbi:MAG: hypothetical protein R2911_39895 [Caldilineaceae bacterium]